jgi:small subunit ribosomal protein S1
VPVAEAEPAFDESLVLDELDEAQEELLKWMLFTDEQTQDDDMDEMVDYDEFDEDVDDDMYEEIDALIEDADYSFRLGDKVMGTVIEVDDEGAYVEIGAKAAAFVPLTECSFARLKSPWEVLRPGMRREFMVVDEEDSFGQVILSLGSLEANVFWQRIRQLQEEDVTVYVTVESVNKGGLLVTYGQYDGFIPISQLATSDQESMEAMIGTELAVKFLEINEEDERLVFSSKKASGVVADAANLKIGDVVEGVVQSVKPFGAFIDVGGITGLLHVSQLTNERVTAVEKVLSEGDRLKVMVLSIDVNRGRLTLSTKKLEPTPGDMLRDPQLVFEKAEEMAKLFKERVAQAEATAGAQPDDGGYTM